MIVKPEFKPKTSAYLRQVERGDQVCITDHGHTVVDIVPHRVDDDREMEEFRGPVRRYQRRMDPLKAEREAGV